MKTVPEMLREGAALYEERNKLYGDNYKKFGPAFIPFLRGIRIETGDDLNRFAILIQVLAKITRYCENFNAGGHDDSLVDMVVYATMLRELDQQ